MKLQIIACLLGSAFFIKAQTFKVTKGEPFEVKKSSWTNDVSGSDTTGFYYFKSTGGYFSTKYILQKFDLKTSKLVYEKDIDLSGDAYLGGKGYYIGSYNKNGKILLFTNAIKGKQNHLLMQEFDCMTGKELGAPLVVKELVDTKAYIISGAELGYFIKFSPDNKKMLLVAEIKRSKKEQNVVGVLYDLAGYKEIWEKPLLSTFENSTIWSFDYCIDNDGNFSYLFSYLRSDKKETYTKGKTIYEYSDIAHGIGMIPNGTSKNTAIAIPSKDITTLDPKLEIINYKLVCRGQYRKGELVSIANGMHENVGFFLLTIDAIKAKIISQSFDYLNEDLMTKLTYSDRGKTYAQAGNKYYKDYKVFCINDCFYQVRLRTIDDGYVGAKGKEIIIYKYNAGNKLEWMKLISRSTDYELNGVGFIVTKKLNLLYYESSENLDLYLKADEYDAKKYKTVKSPKKGVLICTGIDDKGNVTREKLPIGTENHILDRFNYNDLAIKDKNEYIIPVLISSTQRRYDILKIE